MNIPPKYEDVVAQLDAATGREAALREELERFKRLRSVFLKRVLCERDAAENLLAVTENHLSIATEFRDNASKKIDALQQRLTVAEQRADLLEGLLKSGSSPTHAHCSAVMEALKPAEGEGA